MDYTTEQIAILRDNNIFLATWIENGVLRLEKMSEKFLLQFSPVYPSPVDVTI